MRLQLLELRLDQLDQRREHLELLDLLLEQVQLLPEGLELFVEQL